MVGELISEGEVKRMVEGGGITEEGKGRREEGTAWIVDGTREEGGRGSVEDGGGEGDEVLIFFSVVLFSVMGVAVFLCVF